MAVPDPARSLPVVDVAPLLTQQAAGHGATAGLTATARQIEAACREHGFFYVTGHGVAPDLLTRLAQASTAFFALPRAEKMEIAMARGGPAWRGYFPVGAELTSGRARCPSRNSRAHWLSYRCGCCAELLRRSPS